ncbi:MAG TPA: hypothetical protein VLH59_08025 [Ignavibacteriaceae bacterium]|nr:hypothetical protein [Ignavibacteriaceae bacterium]
MIKTFSSKASQFSLALNRSWHIVYFFSLITYLTAYIFLHFQAETVNMPTMVITLIPAIQSLLF